MKKRLLCLLSALVLLAGILPARTARAAESETETQEDLLIALTFDDGPGPETERLLDGLRGLGAKCTFFLVGGSVGNYPETVRRCYEDGHQIASHTFSHPDLTTLSADRIRSELASTENAVERALGFRLRLAVRPPYGNHNSAVLSALYVPAFYWSDDSGDWRPGATADSVYENTMATAGDGDILLLHDTHSWSVDAALRIVADLQAQGYEFVTLSELFRRRGKTAGAGGIYCWCRQNGTNLPGISEPELLTEITPDGTVVTMRCQEGAEIRYTLDGTVPDANAPVYTEPLLLSGRYLLTAVAGFDMNGSRSSCVRMDVPDLRACAAPRISVKNGFASIRSDDTVYYTVDGSAPTEHSLRYAGTFPVRPGAVIRAVACGGAENLVPSKTVICWYCGRPAFPWILLPLPE